MPCSMSRFPQKDKLRQLTKWRIHQTLHFSQKNWTALVTTKKFFAKKEALIDFVLRITKLEVIRNMLYHTDWWTDECVMYFNVDGRVHNSTRMNNCLQVIHCPSVWCKIVKFSFLFCMFPSHLHTSLSTPEAVYKTDYFESCWTCNKDEIKHK